MVFAKVTLISVLRKGLRRLFQDQDLDQHEGRCSFRGMNTFEDMTHIASFIVSYYLPFFLFLSR